MFLCVPTGRLFSEGVGHMVLAIRRYIAEFRVFPLSPQLNQSERIHNFKKGNLFHLIPCPEKF